MPCIHHHEHWHTVHFLQMRTAEVWQKILQKLGLCGRQWVQILGGIMKSCCGCLGQMLVSFSISHSIECCAPRGTPWKVVSLCHHLKQEQHYYQKCVVILYNLRWLLLKFRKPSKIVPNLTQLWKLLKVTEFRTPTPQDVWKKGSKILKLPRFAIVLHYQWQINWLS